MHTIQHWLQAKVYFWTILVIARYYFKVNSYCQNNQHCVHQCNRSFYHSKYIRFKKFELGPKYNFEIQYRGYTVWPQSIWIKVRTSWQIPPQHQSTCLGGPESASVEIPPFRPHFIKFQKKFFSDYSIVRNKRRPYVY